MVLSPKFQGCYILMVDLVRFQFFSNCALLMGQMFSNCTHVEAEHSRLSWPHGGRQAVDFYSEENAESPESATLPLQKI